MSWRVNNQEQLFVSKQAVFDGKKAIRGGVPFVFREHSFVSTLTSPLLIFLFRILIANFGPWNLGPQHGFARTALWTLECPPEKMQSGDVEAVFTFTDTEATRAIWNYP